MVHIKGEVIKEDEVILMHVRRIYKVAISGAADYDNKSWVKKPERRVSGS
jgi:hypothetical protein